MAIPSLKIKLGSCIFPMMEAPCLLLIESLISCFFFLSISIVLASLSSATWIAMAMSVRPHSADIFYLDDALRGLAHQALLRHGWCHFGWWHLCLDQHVQCWSHRWSTTSWLALVSGGGSLRVDFYHLIIVFDGEYLHVGGHSFTLDMYCQS